MGNLIISDVSNSRDREGWIIDCAGNVIPNLPKAGYTWSLLHQHQPRPPAGLTAGLIAGLKAGLTLPDLASG